MAPLKPHRSPPPRFPASPQVVGVAPPTEIGRRCSTHYLMVGAGHGTDVSVVTGASSATLLGRARRPAARIGHGQGARGRPDVTLAPAVLSDSGAISATARLCGS